jgi:hypothetical protein
MQSLPSANTKNVWPFSPQSIPNCCLWLDSADTTSYTSSSSISSWRNKGTAGDYATTTGGTIDSISATINGLPAMSFAADTYMTCPSMTYTEKGRMFYAVITAKSSGTSQTYITGGSQKDIILSNTENGSYADLQASNYDGTNIYNIASVGLFYDTTSLISMSTSGEGGQSVGGGLFVNGTVQVMASQSTYATGSTTTQQIGASSTDSFILGEVIIYDGVTSDYQRLQVEGYLANKWGLQSLLPASHPYYMATNTLVPVYNIPFHPNKIYNGSMYSNSGGGYTLACWFDGADLSTMTRSGNSVIAWKDKVTGVSATGTAGSYPTTSGTGLSFTGTGMTSSIRIDRNSSVGNYIFIVATTTITNGSYINTITTANRGWRLNGTSTGGLNYNFSTGGTSGTITTSATSPFIVAMYDATANTTGSGSGNAAVRYNGVYGPNITKGTTSTGTLTGFNIGGTTRCVIYEILIYRYLTPSDIKQVEGYLVNKWGVRTNNLRSNFPSTHPGRTLGTYSVPFSPKTFVFYQYYGGGTWANVTLACWLDASDISSMVFSGNDITQWKDKSGFGADATVPEGNVPATYSSDYKAIYFGSSSTGYTLNYSPDPNSGYYAMFIVFNNPSPTASNSLLIGGGQNSLSMTCGYSSVSDSCGFYANNVGWKVNTPQGSYTPGKTFLVRGYNGTSLTLNGSASGSTGGTANYTQGTLTLGIDTTGSGKYYNGYIMEILIFNGVIGLTREFNTIEGYLAWKWGIQSSLPSTHPFAKCPP